jgi:nitrile hydratase accessory protein
MTGAPPVPSDLVAAEALLRQADGPGFAEPWMAQAFACAIQLSRQGLFSWSEWVEVFSTEIRAHPAEAGETSNAAYYRQWLAALETIVGLKGAASATEIAERQEAWRQAYLNTPHGQPVELHHAAAAPAAATHTQHHGHHHHHGHHQDGAPKPVAVSPAQR